MLTENTSVCGAVHREDVAQLITQALFSQKAANKVRFVGSCSAYVGRTRSTMQLVLPSLPECSDGVAQTIVAVQKMLCG